VLNIAVCGCFTLITVHIKVFIMSYHSDKVRNCTYRGIVGTTGINKTVYCLNKVGGWGGGACSTCNNMSHCVCRYCNSACHCKISLLHFPSCKQEMNLLLLTCHCDMPFHVYEPQVGTVPSNEVARWGKGSGCMRQEHVFAIYPLMC